MHKPHQGKAMPKKLTSKQIADRQKFVFSKIRSGFSRKEIELSVCDEFGVAFRTATNIYNDAVESLADERPGHQRRNRAAILEMLHSQAHACQLDLLAAQNQIQIKLNLQEQRQVINEQVPQAELSTLPTARPQTIVNMIVAKSRVRAQLVHTISEIARIHGLYREMPLLDAISTLASSDMISPEVAGRMLVAVEDISSSIERAFHKKPSVIETVDDDYDCN
jgi:hypothetical protein